MTTIYRINMMSKQQSFLETEHDQELQNEQEDGQEAGLVREDLQAFTAVQFSDSSILQPYILPHARGNI